MSQFLFVYRGGSAGGTPAEMQQRMEKWMTWMKGLGERGALQAAGHPLAPGGKVVRQGAAITDGPYAEKDLVSGFTIVNARDLAHAAELSSGCPIFEGGGAVEVRPILAM